MSNTKCPYLLVADSELEKVKPEFRKQVKQDAEKCIEGECLFYIGKMCRRQDSSVHNIKIGGEPRAGVYYPQVEHLMECTDEKEVSNHLSKL